MYPKELKTGARTDICVPMYTAALFTSQNVETIQISIDWRIKKNVAYIYIYTLGYYPAFRKSEILIHITWISLENIMLSEGSQTQKDKRYE